MIVVGVGGTGGQVADEVEDLLARGGDDRGDGDLAHGARILWAPRRSGGLRARPRAAARSRARARVRTAMPALVRQRARSRGRRACGPSRARAAARRRAGCAGSSRSAVAGRAERAEAAAHEHGREIGHASSRSGPRRRSSCGPDMVRSPSKLVDAACATAEGKKPANSGFLAWRLRLASLPSSLPPPRGETYRWKPSAPGPWQGPAPSVATRAALPSRFTSSIRFRPAPSAAGRQFRRASLFGEASRSHDHHDLEGPPDWLEEAREALVREGDYLAFEDDERVRVVPLQDGWTRIGRSLSAHVRFDDPTVSRRHALALPRRGRRSHSRRPQPERRLPQRRTRGAGRAGGRRRDRASAASGSSS